MKLIFYVLIFVMIVYVIDYIHTIQRDNYIPDDMKEILHYIQPFSKYDKDSYILLVKKCIEFYSDQKIVISESHIHEIISIVDTIQINIPQEPYIDEIFREMKSRMTYILKVYIQKQNSSLNA